MVLVILVREDQNTLRNVVQMNYPVYLDFIHSKKEKVCLLKTLCIIQNMRFKQQKKMMNYPFKVLKLLENAFCTRWEGEKWQSRNSAKCFFLCLSYFLFWFFVFSLYFQFDKCILYIIPGNLFGHWLQHIWPAHKNRVQRDKDRWARKYGNLIQEKFWFESRGQIYIS